MKLNKSLRSYRKRHHLLQKEMSSLLGVSREHYARVESGKILPGIHLIRRISETLHVTVIVVVPPKDQIYELTEE